MAFRTWIDHYTFSLAKTTNRMNSPLIVGISKFKIDTEYIPIFIPEIAQSIGTDAYPDKINNTSFLLQCL